MDPKQVTEKQLQNYVIDMAHKCGWMTYHTYDSRRSNPGWPDLVLCKPPRIAILELKTMKGRLSVAQTEWLKALDQCPGVETAVIRPDDMYDIRGNLGSLNIPFKLKLT